MIDTHIHFWKLDRGDYAWIDPKNEVLSQDFLPQDLEPLLERNGVRGIIAVQAALTVEETVFLLELARKHSFIKGVSGWLDVASDHFQEQYDRVRIDPYFVGIRVHGNAVKHCHAGQFERMVKSLSALADDGYTLDLLVRPDEMPAVLKLLPKIPNLKVVINHLGLPLAEDGMNQIWRDTMRKVAEYPNTMCKISGMVTFVEELETAAMKRYVADLLEYFGAKRLMFGTDWPVALQGGDYAQTVQFFKRVLPEDLSSSSLQDICFNNAMSFYFGSNRTKHDLRGEL